jgi:hypothetical protein
MNDKWTINDQQIDIINEPQNTASILKKMVKINGL